ncbi:MAG: DUF1572 family protein [Bdellovibrionales bacterium]|nr:DUF1572 family protein [Bdellovibrionales bacterium]
MDADDLLSDLQAQFSRLHQLSENALRQVPKDALREPLVSEGNSILILMKHLAGNFLSRWTDFLTSDGEKPNRNRDREFEYERDDSPEAIKRSWDSAWTLVEETLASLAPEDLARTITIRGEPHSVQQALLRQLSHTSYHVGQIVLLARTFTGDAWCSLSIPRGQSAVFNRKPKRYLSNER